VSEPLFGGLSREIYGCSDLIFLKAMKSDRVGVKSAEKSSGCSFSFISVKFAKILAIEALSGLWLESRLWLIAPIEIAVRL